jgi:hypothetical protein
MVSNDASEIVVLHADSGIPLTTVYVGWNEYCDRLKQAVAGKLTLHMCKFDLVVGTATTETMRNRLSLRRYSSRMVPPNSVRLVFRALDNASCADLFRQGICYKCMRDLSVQVKDIFQYLIDQRRSVCAEIVALREAGYTLREIISARSHFGQLDNQPPVSVHTLFNAQLQDAGFTAGEFRCAGFTAKSLFRDAIYWDDPELTAGEADWEETEVFFTLRELREARYSESDIHELQRPDHPS